MAGLVGYFDERKLSNYWKIEVIRMNKQILSALLAALAVFSFNVSANSFSTTIDVVKQVTPVTIEQKKAMVLPTVRIGKNATEGSVICDTIGTRYFPGKQLCLGQSSNAAFVISGAPFAKIQINLPDTPQYKDGLSFRVFRAKGRAKGSAKNKTKVDNLLANIGKNGRYKIEVIGELTLEDKSKVLATPAMFDFELTAMYN
jgi:hypothetical protein